VAAEEEVEEADRSGYLRVLSLSDATLLVIGSIIGAGIFFTPAQIARATQSPAAFVGVWCLGGVIALCGALTYAELGGLFPRAGGVYVFLREAYGGLFGFLYGWAVLLVIAPGAVAWVAYRFADGLGFFVPGLDVPEKRAVAAATIALLTTLNVLGVRWGSLVQNVFTGAKLLAIAALAGAALLHAGPALEPVAAEAMEPTHGPVVGFLAAMIPVLFSYGGWQNGTYVAAEVKAPRRNVPRAIVLGTLVVIATYVLLNLGFVRLLVPQAIAESDAFASRAAEAALGPIGGSLVAAGIVVSVFGICAAMLLTNPRVAQAIGADGLFFRPFGTLHPRFRTPALAIAVLGTWSIALLFTGRIDDLLSSIVFADWLFFALTAGSLFVLRRKHPDADRPYRCPGYPAVPLVFLLLASAMVAVALATSPSWSSRILGAGLLLAGVPAFFAFRALERRAGKART